MRLALLRLCLGWRTTRRQSLGAPLSTFFSKLEVSLLDSTPRAFGSLSWVRQSAIGFLEREQDRYAREYRKGKGGPRLRDPRKEDPSHSVKERGCPGGARKRRRKQHKAVVSCLKAGGTREAAAFELYATRTRVAEIERGVCQFIFVSSTAREREREREQDTLPH